MTISTLPAGIVARPWDGVRTRTTGRLRLLERCAFGLMIGGFGHQASRWALGQNWK